MIGAVCAPPGQPSGGWSELERLEWHCGDAADAGSELAGFLDAHGLGGEPSGQRGSSSVVLLLGANACAALAGLPVGAETPAPAVPDLVAVALRSTGGPAEVPVRPRPRVGNWVPSWSDAEHARAVSIVRAAIARGDVYQANVVGHRSAPHRGRPVDVAAAAAAIDAAYAGLLTGLGWAVGCASPEQLVRVTDRQITTEPIKGTRPGTLTAAAELQASAKDRAEHVMIVDLERNDLGRLAVPGSVHVPVLYEVAEWAGLLHARSVVAGELVAGVGVLDVLRAMAPGGSVTGAPKRAACALLAGLEPVGRGPAMGAFGTISPGRLDLGLTIRTVAVDEDRVHLWAGGGITWDSEPGQEVAEAHAKAAPLLRALAGPPAGG